MFYVPAAKDKRMKVFPFRRMFVKISNILKSNPDSNFELYLNGKPLNEHFKENN